MSLQILESIKNGVVFSGEYKSGTKIVAGTKVIVMANSFTEAHEAQLSKDRFMILHLKPEMGKVSYEFTYWTTTHEKKTIGGKNGTPGTLKEIVNKMALRERRWKRKFMWWGAEFCRWGFNVHPCLRLQQNGYDSAYHRMKRPQDFEKDDEIPSLTQQGVPDPFSDSESESEDESSQEKTD